MDVTERRGSSTSRHSTGPYLHRTNSKKSITDKKILFKSASFRSDGQGSIGSAENPLGESTFSPLKKGELSSVELEITELWNQWHYHSKTLNQEKLPTDQQKKEISAITRTIFNKMNQVLVIHGAQTVHISPLPIKFSSIEWLQNMLSFLSATLEKKTVLSLRDYFEEIVLPDLYDLHKQQKKIKKLPKELQILCEHKEEKARIKNEIAFLVKYLRYLRTELQNDHQISSAIITRLPIPNCQQIRDQIREIVHDTFFLEIKKAIVDKIKKFLPPEKNYSALRRTLRNQLNTPPKQDFLVEFERCKWTLCFQLNGIPDIEVFPKTHFNVHEQNQKFMEWFTSVEKWLGRHVLRDETFVMNFCLAAKQFSESKEKKIEGQRPASQKNFQDPGQKHAQVNSAVKKYWIAPESEEKKGEFVQFLNEKLLSTSSERTETWQIDDVLAFLNQFYNSMSQTAITLALLSLVESFASVFDLTLTRTDPDPHSKDMQVLYNKMNEHILLVLSYKRGFANFISSGFLQAEAQIKIPFPGQKEIVDAVEVQFYFESPSEKKAEFDEILMQLGLVLEACDLPRLTQLTQPDLE